MSSWLDISDYAITKLQNEVEELRRRNRWLEEELRYRPKSRYSILKEPEVINTTQPTMDKISLTLGGSAELIEDYNKNAYHVIMRVLSGSEQLGYNYYISKLEFLEDKEHTKALLIELHKKVLSAMLHKETWKKSNEEIF